MKHHEFSADAVTVRRAKTIHLTTAALLALSGIYLLLQPEGVNALWLYVTAANFILLGLAGAYGFFSNDLYRLAFQCDLAIGAFGVALGVVMIVQKDALLAHLPLVLGLYILLDGMQKLQIAIEGMRFGIRRWQLILLSALCVGALGVVNMLLALHGQPCSALLGAGMIADGAENFWTTMYTVRVRQVGGKTRE